MISKGALLFSALIKEDSFHKAEKARASDETRLEGEKKWHVESMLSRLKKKKKISKKKEKRSISSGMQLY